jgi:hypothetical protein
MNPTGGIIKYIITYNYNMFYFNESYTINPTVLNPQHRNNYFNESSERRLVAVYRFIDKTSWTLGHVVQI